MAPPVASLIYHSMGYSSRHQRVAEWYAIPNLQFTPECTPYLSDVDNISAIPGDGTLIYPEIWIYAILFMSDMDSVPTYSIPQPPIGKISIHSVAKIDFRYLRCLVHNCLKADATISERDVDLTPADIVRAGCVRLRSEFSYALFSASV